MIRMMPSDPLFPDVYSIVTMIAAYTNPHVHLDLQQVPEEERLKTLDKLTELFLELTH